MQAQKIKLDYSKQKEFWFFFTSDNHFGHTGQDRELLQQEFDLAKERKARILVNGDSLDLILSGDKKRYHPSGDKYGTDNNTNMIIDEAFDFYSEYFPYIDMIGTGNHEVSVSKFHQFDPIQQLIYSLNKKHSKKHKGHGIQHGQYSGFVVLNFHYGKHGASRNFIVYYNHGQGGTAEISKGAIDLNRHLTRTQCDLVWIGHKHTKLVLPSEGVMGVDPKTLAIWEKDRRAIITGAYLKRFSQYDAQKKGYRINYGEEKMRTLQAKGGIFMKVTLNNKHSTPVIKFEV
jgi:hypothetical protein